MTRDERQQAGIWTTRVGEHIHLSQMSNDHLHNTVKHLERMLTDIYCEIQDAWYDEDISVDHEYKKYLQAWLTMVTDELERPERNSP